MKYKFSVKNAHSKRIVKEITDFLGGTFSHYDKPKDFASQFHRDSVCFAVQIFLDTLAAKENLTQYEIFSDRRNNTQENKQNGLYVFTIRFKQQHCVSKTEINFYIRSDDEDIVVPSTRASSSIF